MNIHYQKQIIFIVTIFLVLPIACSDMINKFKAPVLYLYPQSGRVSPSGAMLINNGDAETGAYAVALDLNISNAESMRFSNDGNNWSAWEPYSTAKSWMMAGHGVRSVYGQFRSTNGTIYQTSASIRLFIEEKITASDGAADDNFGGYFTVGIHGSQLSISSDGNTVVVGAWHDDVGSNIDLGSTYVYKWNGTGWNETRLNSSTGTSNNGFGFSVSATSNGNRIIVGSWYGNNYGASDIYTWNTASWEEHRIKQMTGGYYGYGVAVAISEDGNSAIVGSYASDHSAYLYRYDGNNWIETKFTGFFTDFGFHVDISANGNTIVIGNPYWTPNAVYIYRWNGSTWDETILNPSDTSSNIMFGRIVSMSFDGNIVATGAYQDTIGANNWQGSVYVYRWDGSAWNETKITASDGRANDYFGYSVSLSGDGSLLLAGSPGNDIGGKADQGAAYQYTWNGSAWTGERKITASDGAARDYFGYTVSVSSETLTLGAGAPGWNTRQGAVYLY
jgi:hypothetical protein